MTDNDRLIRIEGKIDGLCTRVGRIEGAVGEKAPYCLLEKERIDRLETVQGKHGIISAVIGAISAGVTLAVAYLVTRGSS